MKKLTYKIGTGLATAALIASSVAPAAFAQTIDITGNGRNSDNSVVFSNSNTTVFDQSTRTRANTVVNNTAKTGNNTANDNTGDGDVDIDTGDATNTTTVTVTGGDNRADLDLCGCQAFEPDVTIDHNGRNSYNHVAVLSNHTIVFGQRARTRNRTRIMNKAKTGKNKANHNTGSGDVDILTGNARNTTHVTVEGGSNVFNP